MPELSQHVCFHCRKVFKKPHWYGLKHDSIERPQYPCPECGNEMTYMGYKFRAPKKSDEKEWLRIEKAIFNGEDWTIRTIRKEEKKEKPKLSANMRNALGVANASKNRYMKSSAKSKRRQKT